MENIPLTKQATKKKLRQFLSIALAFTTTVSLSGFALLFAVTASAAVTPLSDGDLVRGPDGIKVYIVKPSPHGTYAGWKRHIFNPAVFNMYGHLKWESIQSVNQETVDAYQTSDLYKELNDPRVYSLEESGTSAVKRWIENEAAFLANGYSWSQIFTVNEAERDYYVSGAPITTTVVTPPVTPPVTPATGTGLTVSLASNTPAAGSIVSDSTGDPTFTDGAQAMASMLTANFAAGSDGDVTVTTVKVKRLGISADSDISNAYLYDGNTRVAEMTNISSTYTTFTNSAGLFTVSKGTSKSITVKMDLVNGASAGKTIAFSINAASDVTAGSATVAGSYPIVGNYMTTARVSDLGQLTFTTPTAPSSVDPGQTGIEVLKLPLTAADQKLKVSYIRFTNVGTIATTDVTNFKLMDGATQLGSTASSLGTDGTVAFDLSASPLEITAGQTKNLSLTADIVAGTSRNFKFTIQRASDVVAMDTNYGTYVKPGKTDSFTIQQPTSSTSVTTGTLTVSVDPASPTGNVAAGYTDQEFARFQFKASGEAVKVTSLTATSSGTAAGAGINNAKLYLDGTQVGSTADIAAVGNTTYTFGNSFIVPAGATKILVIKGEVKNAAGTDYSANNTIQVKLVAGSLNAQGQISLTSINTTAANGNTLSVQTGVLSVAANSGLANADSSNPTGVKGANGVKIGSFVITAGSGEAVSVTQMVVKNSASLGSGLGSDFQNLRLMNGATQIGTQIGSLSTTASNTYTFTPATSITVNAGQQYVVDVYVDVLTGATNTGSAYVAVIMDSVTATGKSTNTDASWGSAADANGQNIYLSTGGSLAVTIGSDTPIAQNRVMGDTGQTLATFKFTTGAAEAINVSKIIVTDTITGSTTAATGSITNLKLFNASGVQVGTTVASMTSSSATTTINVMATFDGLTMQVAKDKTEILTLKGDVNGYPNAISNSSHTFKIVGVGDITSVGATTGASVVPSLTSAVGTAQTAYRAELTVANAMSNMTGGATTQQQVGKYTFTNKSPGNYTITVSDIDLNISSSLGVAAATTTITLKKDSPSGTTLATATVNTGSSLANISNFSLTSFTIDASNGTGSVDVYVLIDTSNFTISAGKTVSTSISASGVTWTDNTSGANASTGIDAAPVYGATITY